MQISSRTVLSLFAGSGMNRDRRRIYRRNLPVRRLWKICAAMFFSLATAGFFVDLIAWGLMSIPEVLAWVTLCGGFAVAIFLADSKQRKLIPVVVILYVIATFVLSSRPHTAKLPPLLPVARLRVAFDAIGLLSSCILGFTFFLLFVDSEGAQMVALETELSLAHRLQERLVPTLAITANGYEVYAKTIPSDKVGGDLVDGIESGGAVTAYVADVSGHGISAGTLMGMIKMAARLFASNAGGPINPAAMLNALNRALPSVKEPNMFATAACVTVRSGGEVSFSIAGHGPLLHYVAGTAEVRSLQMEQFPLGLFAAAYENGETGLVPGDILAICTDGILEAENKDGEAFGYEPLKKILAAHCKRPLEEIFAEVMKSVYSYCPRPNDDCSLLLLRRS